VWRRVEYDYELASGNVRAVHYQNGAVDQFHHAYEYDADNRLKEVFTSADSVLWDKDGKYFYYDHGPLARTETGDLKTQGMDYVYSIHGWLKGMNSNTLDSTRDVGNDATSGYLAAADSIHRKMGRDAYGYTLGYYDDDYTAIILKALADRLAEAFAERLHQRVRTERWGYSKDEHLDNAALIAEQYRGIRPAPGYPACPDHTEKATLWQLLDVDRTAGITLTENFAMLPTAAVSGWYFAHPDAHYFAVGKLGQDQVEDYAKRKGWGLDIAERWLSPNLGYDAQAA